jgi:hypothetical protein
MLSHEGIQGVGYTQLANQILEKVDVDDVGASCLQNQLGLTRPRGLEFI